MFLTPPKFTRLLQNGEHHHTPVFLAGSFLKSIGTQAGRPEKPGIEVGRRGAAWGGGDRPDVLGIGHGGD